MEKNKVLMIIIIVLLVVLLGAIAFLGFSFAKYMSTGKEASVEQAAEAAVATLTPDEVEIVPLTKPINTNLAPGTDGKYHVISVNLSIGADNTDKKESPKIVEMLVSKESIIRDICGNTIRNKTFEELQRPDGKDILSKELLTRIKDEFQSNLIYHVYITDWYLE